MYRLAPGRCASLIFSSLICCLIVVSSKGVCQGSEKEGMRMNQTTTMNRTGEMIQELSEEIFLQG